MAQHVASSQKRSLARFAALALITTSVVFQAIEAGAADGVFLTVKKGPFAGDLTLDWTGGQPTFDVYRSTSPVGLVSPGNLVTSLPTRSLTTPQGTDTGTAPSEVGRGGNGGTGGAGGASGASGGGAGGTSPGNAGSAGASGTLF